jgi:hypothetical protein
MVEHMFYRLLSSFIVFATGCHAQENGVERQHCGDE